LNGFEDGIPALYANWKNRIRIRARLQRWVNVSGKRTASSIDDEIAELRPDEHLHGRGGQLEA
jgi:hypothetical protein